MTMKLVPQQPGSREIKVKLVLSGGHAAMLALPPEHPVLAQLLQTVTAPAKGRPESLPAVFEIPVEGGRASLTFASHQLVGGVTRPAVLVQPETADAPASPRIIRRAVAQIDAFVNSKFGSTDTFQLVEPRNNSIVFFNAAIVHEVVPVHVPSKDFAHSRFTVNGGVHRT